MVWLWLKRKVLLPVRIALKNGISHKRLAVSLSLGIILGLIPFYGFTTILVGVFAYALRLDFIIMQAVHYLVYPVQIALMIPFFKVANLLIVKSSVDFSFKEYVVLLKSDFWSTISDLWKLNLSAIVIWMIISIPLFILLYRAFIISIQYFASIVVHKPVGKVQ